MNQAPADGRHAVVVGDSDRCDGGAQMEVFKLRKQVVWVWQPVKDKKAKDLASAYCHHPESSLM